MNLEHTNSVPEDLKKLLRIIALNFYGFEYYLCIEYLNIYSCIREDELAEILKLDLKALHQYLMTLKKDHFLNEKLMIDIQKDGKHVKHSFFYINYIAAVNVIKFKLDKIRDKVEKEDLETTKSFFYCVNCHHVFSEYDLKDIFMTMRCSRCYGEVREETKVYKNLLKLFNSQLKPVFDLLNKVDKLKLPDSVLRPVAHNENYAHRKVVLGEQINYVRKEDLENPKGLEILKYPVHKIEDDVPKKEFRQNLELSILDKLLKYEYKSIKADKNDQRVPDDVDDIPDERNFPTIMVNGKAVRFDKISPELTNEMNEQEKETYISVISDLYTQVFDNYSSEF
ncbi:unnamed protein product [Brachionus calyciflorus]|uniref:HTH TFE/IIEalpha-type domain-containing protein n=1 Tax=Brachionus calyciflorus TaxID=104777 RepID=A0A813LW53_9BILA|nr:unnamed protein product [Brachionus calyciflorus]